MNTKFLNIPIFLISLIFCACTNQKNTSDNEKSAADPIEIIDQEIEEVETLAFENDFVKAMKISLEPNQQLPWHKGGPRIIYSLSDYSIRLRKDPDDTTTQVSTFEAGDIHWHDQNIHTVENIGSSTAEFMVFMRKPSTFPDEADTNTASDVEETKPSDTNILLENAAVKVINVQLDPGEMAPKHTGTRRLIYSLSNYEVSFNKPGQSSTEQDYEKGDVHWHEGGEHSVENTGDSKAEFIVMEFKK